MTKAFGYARVSSQGQVDSDGFKRQTAAINQYCSSHNLDRLQIFYEEAVPGKTEMEQRPAFMEMVGQFEEDDCKTVVVEGLDRLAREFRVQEMLITYLAARGISLISANTGENVTDAYLGDPMRRAMVQIQGIISELDKNMIVSKLSKARRRVKARDGKCEGRKAFGDKPGEKEILERIVNMKAMSYTPTEIATCLNVDGAATRYAKRWHAATISKILRRS